MEEQTLLLTPEAEAGIDEYNEWITQKREQDLIWTDGESSIWLDEADMKLVAEAVREAYPKEWVDQILKERAAKTTDGETSEA